MNEDENASKSRAQICIQTKSSWVIQHQVPKKKPMYALVQYVPMECLLQPRHCAKPCRAEARRKPHP